MIIVLKAFHNIGQHNNHAFYPTPSLRTTIRGSISVLLCRKPVAVKTRTGIPFSGLLLLMIVALIKSKRYCLVVLRQLISR
ncbi:unnamed protein product [Rhizophagus irregularis]|nr:unnamed protein product [Rhizophagus irregularis]